MADLPSDLTWALDAIAANALRSRGPRDYYEGRHPLAFAGEKFREAFGGQFKAFADNLMPVVADTVADRLQVSGFRTGKDPADLSARDIWRRNRMAKRAGEVHQDALVDADAVVIVWPDPADPSGRAPVLYPNRIANMAIRYHEEQPGFIVRAAKSWVREDKRTRLTIWYADRLEKYISTKPLDQATNATAVQFERFEAPGEAWPLPNPWGKVPVFHFANRAGIGEMGTCEFAEGVALQDVLNKAVCDRVVAQEFYAFPQRWALGIDREAIGKAKVRPGGVWAEESENAAFGAFPAGDIGVYVAVEESTRKEIARVTRTPLHYFTMEGTMPSGESMKTADAPLIAKVRDRQVGWGMVWADVMRFALQMAGAGDFDVETLWENTEPRNEVEQIQIAQGKLSLGVPRDEVLKEYGYTQAQIDEFADERATVDVIPNESL